MNKQEMEVLVFDALSSLGDLGDTVKIALGYIAMNDKAHDYDHVLWVTANAIQLVDKVEKAKPFRNEIILAAFLHDIGCHLDRKKHEIVGMELTEMLFEYQIKAPIDRELVVRAIGEHRASYGGHRYHIVSEVVAAADKGAPDARKIIKRMMEYRLNNRHYPLTGKESVKAECLYHLKEKYSTKGYLLSHATPLYMELYGEEQRKIAAFIDDDSNTIPLINELYDQIFNK